MRIIYTDVLVVGVGLEQAIAERARANGVHDLRLIEAEIDVDRLVGELEGLHDGNAGTLQQPPRMGRLIDTDDDELMTGVEKVYSTAEAAEFFGKSNQWLYWGLRNNIFVDVNGNTIEPHRIGKGKRRRFTLPIIREIALACYRRGNLKEDELKAILRKILLAEHGEGAFDPAE